MQAAAVVNTPMVPNTVMPVPDAAGGNSAEPSDFARQMDLANAAAEPEAAPSAATEEAAVAPTPPINDVAALLAGLTWLAPQPAELAKQAPEAVDSDKENPDAALLTDAAASTQAMPILALPMAPLPQPLPAPQAEAPAAATATSPGVHATRAAPAALPTPGGAEPQPPDIKPALTPTPAPLNSEAAPASRSTTFDISSSAAAMPLALPDATPTLAPPHAPTLSTAPSAAAPFHAALTVALGSPEFAPALSTQVSMLARNGIGEARLHLHPAELGPINVQIELDGQRAKVNMSAEHALTRQALEQALPTLASALREAGLTLSGGGVFQHPPQQGQRGGQGGQDTPHGHAQRGHLAADGEQRPELRVRVQQGAVDLYA